MTLQTDSENTVKLVGTKKGREGKGREGREGKGREGKGKG